MFLKLMRVLQLVTRDFSLVQISDVAQKAWTDKVICIVRCPTLFLVLILSNEKRQQKACHCLIRGNFSLSHHVNFHSMGPIVVQQGALWMLAAVLLLLSAVQSQVQDPLQCHQVIWTRMTNARLSR